MDVFYGRVTDNAAHVYVRLPRDGAGDARSVAGTIRGPFCQLSHTLPATYVIRDTGAGPTLLGTATIADPCFWSTQLPALYDVHVELRTEGQVVETFDQTVGIRRLGVAGHNLFWESKRWVLRGVGNKTPNECEGSVDDRVASFREASAAMLMVDPDEAVCRRASQAGVILVARLTDPATVRAGLNALSRWGAVAVAILPEGMAETREELHHAAPNLLRAQSCTDGVPVKPADWADLIVCRVSEPAQFHAAVAGCPLPIVAERGLNELTTTAAARSACDHLQRDLAPGGDYAGYFVTQP